MERQSQDATQVVPFREVFILGEVPHYVVPVFVLGAQYIEQERHDCVQQEFMVQKQLGEVAQVLAVGRIFVAIDLKHSELSLVVLVYLVAWRVYEGAELHVVSKLAFVHVETQTEFAVVQTVDVVVAVRIGGVVPGFCCVFAELDSGDGFDLCGFFVISSCIFIEAFVFFVT